MQQKLYKDNTAEYVRVYSNERVWTHFQSQAAFTLQKFFTDGEQQHSRVVDDASKNHFCKLSNVCIERIWNARVWNVAVALQRRLNREIAKEIAHSRSFARTYVRACDTQAEKFV